MIMFKNSLLPWILELKWKEVPGQCRKITQCGPSYFAFLNFTFLNKAANETNYTVFRVECLSYSEEFWKLCEMKWRCSVTEMNGHKQETPQSRYFASGPRFERSTLKITIRSFVDGPSVPDVMQCSLVDMEFGLKVEEYLCCDNGGRVSSKFCKPPNKLHYVVSYGNNTFNIKKLVSK